MFLSFWFNRSSDSADIFSCDDAARFVSIPIGSVSSGPVLFLSVSVAVSGVVTHPSNCKENKPRWVASSITGGPVAGSGSGSIAG